MHRYTLALIAATLLFAACRGPEPQPETQQPLPIVTLHGKSCFELTTRDTVPIIDDTYMDVENEFTINWPSLDSFPPATRRALILLACWCFGNITYHATLRHYAPGAATLEEARLQPPDPAFRLRL